MKRSFRWGLRGVWLLCAYLLFSDEFLDRWAQLKYGRKVVRVTAEEEKMLALVTQRIFVPESNREAFLEGLALLCREHGATLLDGKTVVRPS